MKKKSILFLLSGLVALFAVHSQNGPYDPFVTGIKTGVRGEEVKISWADAPEPVERYRLYRHTRKIDAASFAEAEDLGPVNPGVESFVDKPPLPGDYFYAVLAEGERGVFSVFLPHRNSSGSAVSVSFGPGGNDKLAWVRQITITAGKDSLSLEFSADRPDRDLLVFRSTAPIRESEQLLRQKPAARLRSSETGLTDYPVPGIPYYYAVLDAELVSSGGVLLEPGLNTSGEGVMIPLPSPPARASLASLETEISTRGGKRPSLPLPFLILSGKVSPDELLPERVVFPSPQELEPQTRLAVLEVAGRGENRKPLPMDARILDQDQAPPRTREDLTLKTILDGPFREGDWTETERLLDHYRFIDPSEEALARAGFYRAQSCFFQQRLKDSFTEFLLIRDRYYPEVAPWLDQILLQLRLKRDPF